LLSSKGEFSGPIISVARNLYARAQAQYQVSKTNYTSLCQLLTTLRSQGGLSTGKDPTQLNTSDPIRLWIVQLGKPDLLFSTSVILADTMIVSRCYCDDDPTSLAGFTENAAAKGHR
jgi:hypothetical protein